MSILYFEGAGMDFYEGNEYSDIGNFRIRTSFKNLDGEQFYLELGRGSRYNEKGKCIFEWSLVIDFLFKVTGGLDDCNENRVKTDFKEIRKLDYTKTDITKWINENLNCNFDSIQCLNQFYGYRVRSGYGVYNLMEDIELNHERAIAREKAFNKIDMEYRQLLNAKYSQINLISMDDEGIVVRCHASDTKLGDNPRILKVPV